MRVRTFNLYAASGLLALASVASAQTSSDTAGATELEEIIVTARRVEGRLQDVPISMTVFSQEKLNRNNVTSPTDLANITPSLSVNNNYGGENTTFAIRGFVQDAATAASVGNYFADVVAPRGPAQGTSAGDGLGPGAFFDLQHIQVLKGPQGTLQGRNTTGGAVMVVPQKPTSRNEGYAEVAGGNYGMKRVQAVTNLPFSDTVRFRIGADYQKRDGWLHNISGIGPRDYNDVNYIAARASLVVDLTPNLENYTIASYSKSDTNGSLHKLIAAGTNGVSPANPQLGFRNLAGIFSTGRLRSEAARGAGFWDVAAAAVPNPQSLVEQKQFINTTTCHTSDGLTIKNIASYAEFEDTQRSPLFGPNWQLSTLPVAYQAALGPAGGIPYFAVIYPAPGLKTADQRTYTEELQLQGSFLDQRLTYQGGAYFEWSDPLNAVGAQSPVFLSCANAATLICTDTLSIVFTGAQAAALAGAGVPPPYPDVRVGALNYNAGKTTYRDRGIYAQSSYSRSDQFKLTAGLRYTWDKQSNEATRITYAFPVQAPFTAAPTRTCVDAASSPSCVQSLEQKSSKPTWLIGLDYKPNEDALLYAKYARGYRAGGVFPAAPIDHRVFTAEKLDNFELGLKSSFHGPVPGGFNVAAFYNDFSDQQLQFGYQGPSTTVTSTTAVINAGKSRIYGSEVELSIKPLASDDPARTKRAG